MTKSKSLFAAIAVAGFALTLAGIVATPFDQGARAADGYADVASERIEAAFSLVQTDLSQPVPVRVSKGDLPPCVGQTWPNIAVECLVAADGAPVRQARMVTIGHQSGPTETVLIRLPLAALAMR